MLSSSCVLGLFARIPDTKRASDVPHVPCSALRDLCGLSGFLVLECWTAMKTVLLSNETLRLHMFTWYSRDMNDWLSLFINRCKVKSEMQCNSPTPFTVAL